LIADLGRAVFRIPAALYLQLINDCKPYFPKENPDGLNSVALFKELEERHCKGRGQRLAVFIGEDVRTNSERWSQISRLVATYLLKAFAGAIVDALGTSAWGNMLRRTKTLFHTPQEFDIRDNRGDSAVKRALDSMPTGALAKFFSRLIVYLDQDSCP